MIGKCVRAVFAAGLVVVLVWTGGGKGLGSAVVGFGLFGYLLWRAWPSIVVDVRRLAGVRPPGRFARSSVRGGDGLL